MDYGLRDEAIHELSENNHMINHHEDTNLCNELIENKSFFAIYKNQTRI